VVAVDEESGAMTLTLAGRLQTRAFLILIVGLPWTCIITPVLAAISHTEMLAAYRLTLPALALMALLGAVWECVYHVPQQVRWDRDWPSSFALLTVLNEAAALWLALAPFGTAIGVSGLTRPPLFPFALHIGTTWVLIWLVAQGPLRTLLPRWRFQGGRILNS
jgi:hypothetical protein